MSSLGENIAESAEGLVGTPFKLGGFSADDGVACIGLWIRAAADHVELVEKAIPVLERGTLVRDEFNPMTRHFSDVMTNTEEDPASWTVQALGNVIQEVDPQAPEAGDLHIYEGGGINPCAYYHAVVVCKDIKYLVQACRSGVVRVARRRMSLEPTSALRMVCQ